MKQVFGSVYPILVIVFVLAPCTLASVLLVPQDHPTIQDAINLAATGDTIQVADGLYSGQGFTNIDTMGKEITVTSENGPENCILSGGQVDRLFYIHQDETFYTVIDGFKLVEGFSADKGGAIYCDYSSPTIQNCIIENCHAPLGGGLALYYTAITANNIVFRNNTASEKGGGLYVNGPGYGGGSPRNSYTECQFTQCESLIGGAVYILGSRSDDYFSCEFTENTALDSGGAIAVMRTNSNHAYYGPSFFSTTMIGNRAKNFGGALYGSLSKPAVSDCHIENNEAKYGGAFYLSGRSNLEISGSVITGNKAFNGGACFTRASSCVTYYNMWASNSATENGGAIFSSDTGGVYGPGNTFRENTAQNGGALYNTARAIPYLENADFILNRANESGGAVYLFRSGPDNSGNTQPTFFSCNFEENIAGIHGGAIAFTGQNNHTEEATRNYMCDFRNNISPTGADLYCLYEQSKLIETENCTFQGNIDLKYYVHNGYNFDFESTTNELTPVNQDVYVKTDGSDSNDGLTWATAFQTIQHALSVMDSTSGDVLTIHVAAGTYSPSATGEKFPLALQNNVRIMGSDGMDNVIIDAEQTGRVFAAVDGMNTTLWNLTITGGEADKGAGVYIENSEVLIDTCKISGNRNAGLLRASDPNGELIGGGGVYILHSNPLSTNSVIRNSRIEDNHSATFGGGILVIDDSNVLINNNTFAGNTAGMGQGAALATGGNTTVEINATNNVFEYNHQSSNIVSPQDQFSLNDCSYQKNLLISGSIYVSPTGSNDNTGRSIDQPFQTIQHAVKVVDTSQLPVTIHLASGTYSFSENSEQFPVPLRNRLTLIGSDPKPVLDAAFESCVIVGDGVSDTYVSNISVVNGLAAQGAGVFLYDSSTDLFDVDVSNCEAYFTGGGLHIESSGSCNISDCRFNSNTAKVSGGGCHNINSYAVNFNNTEFNYNSANNGGGIYSAGYLSLIDTTKFHENSAEYGGGLVAEGFGTSVRDSHFSNNEAIIGGAVVNRITANYTNTIFDGNQASYHGGAVMLDFRSASFYNCQIINNDASEGAALSIIADPDSVRAYLYNCTVADNRAKQMAGGILTSDYSDVMVRNSILWNNSFEQLTTNGQVEVAFSDIQNGWPGTGNIDADPLFVTGFGNDYFLSHQVSGQTEDSPCINSGSDLASEVCYPEGIPGFCMADMTTRTDLMNDIGIVDMGYHASIDMTPTPTHTPVVTPTPTSTDTPEITPAPTFTPTPTPDVTPTSTPYQCDATGVEIVISDTLWVPGETVYCGVWVTNLDNDSLETPLFVIMEVLGDLYFAPEFNEYSYYDISYPTGSTWMDVLEPFVWPDTGTSMDGIYFYSALTNEAITEIIGEWDSVMFGYR